MATQSAPGGATPPQPTGHPRRWVILVVLIVSLLVVVLDNTVLNVALKTISDPKVGLGASQSDLEWAINAYTLVFAGLLFTWGILGDRMGRKKILVLGMVLFGLASLWCSASTSPGELIAARAAMGFGGAAIMPATLAIIANVFEPREQPKAIGIWAGAVGLGVAIGPVVGGALLQDFWWGSVFLINVPIVIAGVVAMLFLVPDSKNPNPGKLDPVGVVLSMAGLVAFIYGIIRGGDLGVWSKTEVWASLVIGVVLLVGFVYWERASDHPALDVRLFKSPRFSSAVISVGLSFFAMMGVLFFLAFFLQSVRGYSPLGAGLWLTPFAVAQLIFSPLSATMVRKFGPRDVSTSGLVVIAITFLLYLTVGRTSPMWVVGVIFFLQGMGMANVMPPATTAIMASLPREKAGVGSSVNNTVRQVGGALGVAVLGTVLTSNYRSKISPDLTNVPPAAKHDVSGSIQATLGYVEQAKQAHPQAAALVDPAKNAFMHAMHITVLGSAAFSIIAAIVVFLWMPKSAPQGGPGTPRTQTDEKEAVAA